METQIFTDKARRVIKTIIMIGVLLMVAYGALYIFQEMSRAKVAVVATKTTFTAELAQDEAARKKGLSGKNNLGKNEAMLFVFPHDERWEFWMKDVNFPIDIVWIDKNKKVVHIEKNVEPDPEPYDIYKPKKPARYVLEVAAGQAAEAGLSVGASVYFDLEKDE